MERGLPTAHAVSRRWSRRRMVAGFGLAILLGAAGAGIGYVNNYYETNTVIQTGWCRGAPGYAGPASFKDSTPAAFETGTKDTGPYIDTSPYLMPGYQTVSFPSRDAGVTIVAWWVPADAPDAPAVVLVHGRRRCRGDPEVLIPAGMLHRHGISALVIDLRNHGDSTVTDNHHSWGVKESQDALGAWDWLRGSKGLAADRIGLYGVSLGAATATIAAGREPRVAALWEDSSFASFELSVDDTIAKLGIPEPFRPAVASVTDALHHVPDSPLREVAQLHGRPFAIVHGTADSMSIVANAYRLRDAVAASGGSVEPWILPGVEHVRASFVATAEYESRLVAFFSAALGASEAAP